MTSQPAGTSSNAHTALMRPSRTCIEAARTSPGVTTRRARTTMSGEVMS
jgi:hypothetical protein